MQVPLAETAERIRTREPCRRIVERRGGPPGPDRARTTLDSSSTPDVEARDVLHADPELIVAPEVVAVRDALLEAVAAAAEVHGEPSPAAAGDARHSAAGRRGEDLRGGPEHGLVAAGLATTTLAPVTLDVLPDGVTPVAVRGEPQETRRIVLARLPGPLEGPAATVADALIATSPA